MNFFSALYYHFFVWKKKYVRRFEKVISAPPDTFILSLGNATVGGTGKTPLSLYFAKQNLILGKKVALVLRGYKGKKNNVAHFVLREGKILSDWVSSGDEPYLLAMSLRKYINASVVVGKKRSEAVRLALENGYNFIILDDGHQRWDVIANFYTLLWDLTIPLEKIKLLPWGRLREPLTAALKRAHLVILTRSEQANENNIQLWQNYFKRKRGNIPIFKAYFAIDKLIPFSRWKQGDEFNNFISLKKDVQLLSGIGNPQSFKKNIEQLGYKVRKENNFPDHYSYSSEEVKKILKDSSYPVIITAKDGVKMLTFPFSKGEEKKLYVAHQTVILKE